MGSSRDMPTIDHSSEKSNPFVRFFVQNENPGHKPWIFQYSECSQHSRIAILGSVPHFLPHTENLEDQIYFAAFGRVKVWTSLLTHFACESNSRILIQPKYHHQKSHLSVTFLMVTPRRIWLRHISISPFERIEINFILCSLRSGI